MNHTPLCDAWAYGSVEGRIGQASASMQGRSRLSRVSAPASLVPTDRVRSGFRVNGEAGSSLVDPGALAPLLLRAGNRAIHRECTADWKGLCQRIHVGPGVPAPELAACSYTPVM